MGKRNRAAGKAARADRKRKATEGGIAFARALIRAIQDHARLPDPRDFEVDGVRLREVTDQELRELWAAENRPPGLEL